MKRDYDLVVFGATGFTGELVVRYLAKHAPTACRWAIAGRNRAKLESLRARVVGEEIAPAIDVLIADVGDEGSLFRMASRARAVLSTVGPYIELGEPVLRACVEAGAHHLDITGEPAFLDLARERYHDRAREKGVKLVHCCGLDSVPADIGAFDVARRFSENEEKTVRGYLATNARPGGGTLHSALRAMADGTISLALDLIQPVGSVSTLRPIRPRIHRVRELGGWALPMPAVDARIVRRSTELETVYGPRFQYGQFFVCKTLLGASTVLLGTLALVLAAKVRPVRRWIERLVPAGTGPSEDRRARTWFTFTFIGESASKKVVTRLRGGDPGYDEASKMVAECGLALVEDEERLPRAHGVVSPIGAIGACLIARLARAGISFEVLEERPTAAKSRDRVTQPQQMSAP